MKRILKSVYENQWLIFAAVWAICFVATVDGLDIAIHDTYIVLDSFILVSFALMLVICLWGLFRFVEASRSIKLLSHIHLIVISLLLIICIAFLFYDVNAPRRYTDYSVYEEFDAVSLDSVISGYGYNLVTWLVLLGLLLFPVQWLYGFLRRGKQS